MISDFLNTSYNLVEKNITVSYPPQLISIQSDILILYKAFFLIKKRIYQASHEKW